MKGQASGTETKVFFQFGIVHVFLKIDFHFAYRNWWIDAYLPARKTQGLLTFQKKLFSYEINITICVRFRALR